MATNSRHSRPGQTHFGLTKHLGEPAHNNRVESPPQNSDPDLWDVGNSHRGHVCNSPQHASSPVYVSDPGASSTGDRWSVTRLAGVVDVHVSTVPPVETVVSTVPTSTSTSLCGLFLYCRDLLSQKAYASVAKSYRLHAWRVSCSTSKHQDFQRGL